MQTQFVALLPRTLIRFYVRLLNIWRSTLALIRTNSPGICTRQLGHWCPVYTDVCVGAGDVSPIFFNELMMHSCAHHNCSYIRCTRKIRKLCWIYLFRRDKLRCNIDYYYRKKKALNTLIYFISFKQTICFIRTSNKYVYFYHKE